MWGELAGHGNASALSCLSSPDGQRKLEASLLARAALVLASLPFLCIGFMLFRTSWRNYRWSKLNFCATLALGLASLLLVVRFSLWAMLGGKAEEKTLLVHLTLPALIYVLFQCFLVLGEVLTLSAVVLFLMGTDTGERKVSVMAVRVVAVVANALVGISTAAFFWVPVEILMWIQTIAPLVQGSINLSMLTFLPFKPLNKEIELSSREWKLVRSYLFVLLVRKFLVGVVRLPLSIRSAFDDDYEVDSFLFVFVPFMIDAMPLLAAVRLFWNPLDSSAPAPGGSMEGFKWRKWMLLLFLSFAVLIVSTYGVTFSCLSAMGRELGIPVVFARAPIRALLLAPLLLLPRISWLTSLIGSTALGLQIPFEYFPQVHRLLAWFTLVLVVLHAIGHAFLLSDKAGLAKVNVTPSELLFPSWTLGWIAFVGFIISFLAGIVYYSHRNGRSRRYCRINFEAFWLCHLIGAAIFFVFSSIHGAWMVFGDLPVFWIPMAAMMIVVVIDGFLRSRSGDTAIIADQCLPIPNFGFELAVRTELKCKNLSYINIKLPGWFQMWHPYSVYSYTKVPDSKTRIVRVIVQTEGDDDRDLGWSRELGKYAKISAPLSIEGPFRSSLARAADGAMDGVVIVAMGTGVASALSLVNYLNRKAPDIPVLVLLSTRTLSSASFAGHRLSSFRKRRLSRFDSETWQGSLAHLDTLLFFTGPGVDKVTVGDWSSPPKDHRVIEPVMAGILIEYADKWMHLSPPSRRASASVNENTHLLTSTVSSDDLLPTLTPHNLNSDRISSALNSANCTSDFVTEFSAAEQHRAKYMNQMFPEDRVLKREPCCCSCFPSHSNPGDHPYHSQLDGNEKRLPLRNMRRFHVFYCGGAQGGAMVEAATRTIAQAPFYTFEYHAEEFS